MLAKCRQKQFLSPKYNYANYQQQEDQYLIKNTQNPYFKELKTN